MVEIERKYLVERLPEDHRDARSSQLRQGYVLASAEGEVRLREAFQEYSLTVKSAGSLVRSEYEVDLSREQFEALWPATEGRRIEKRRYEVDLDSTKAVVDVYSGRLEGLCVVEVEFVSEQEAHAFIPPLWFGTEVTDDPAYKNAALASGGRHPSTQGPASHAGGSVGSGEAGA